MFAVSNRIKKGAAVTLALTMLTPAFAAFSATSAEASWRRHHGGVVAAGVIGGLALGALAAGAYARPAYAAPVYAEPAYAPRACYWTRVRERVDYDTVVVRRVRVCD
jgi:hypothetical protein